MDEIRKICLSAILFVIVFKGEWLDALNWIVDHSAVKSDSLSINSAIYQTRKIGTGSAEKRYKCRIASEIPVDLSDKNVFGIDIRNNNYI